MPNAFEARATTLRPPARSSVVVNSSANQDSFAKPFMQSENDSLGDTLQAREPSVPARRLGSIPQTTRQNLKQSMGDGANFGAMVGLGESYLPAFALALGLGETSAGLVASLPVVAGGGMQLVSLRAMRWLGTEQRWVVLCASIQALAFLPLVIAALSGFIGLPGLLLVASIYWGAGLASGPAWNTWMETVVPSQIRAGYFSNRTRLQQLATLIAFVGGGALLQTAQNQGWLLTGFASIFLLAAIFRSISAACLALHRTNPRLTSRQSSTGDSRRLTTSAAASGATSSTQGISKSGKRLLVYLVAVQACVQVSGPFFAPYMLKQLGMDYYQFVFLVAVAFLSRVLALAMWTRIASHFGASTLLWIGAIGLVPLSAMWTVSANIWWLMIAQFFSGIAWAAYELGFFLLFFETLPANQRTKLLTLYNFANTLAMFAGATLGAVLLNSLGCTLNAYLVLFGLSSCGRAVALILLLRADLKPVPIRTLAVRVLGIRPATATLDVPILPSLLRIRAKANGRE
ncbi:MFS transporter [Aureliella helgolandensis]|uniref:Major Facilitator Superfamily protein n=1 Tax=Aureliella helgolandensis TaxID=2527968 RepID=A0A518G030_9BACT|nr:MFS transporter [Aureliella helgolandensis]QDV21953.1 Major Facilitator Superfamily protein [Aureliella helgolandensis]